MLLQVSIDPSTWFVGLPSGTPRMSSPIILKRDLTTFTYLANKRNLRGLSLHLLQKTWKLHQQSYARRATILKLITGWNVDGSRYALYTQDPQAKLVNARCPLCLAPDSNLHWICEYPCPALFFLFFFFLFFFKKSSIKLPKIQKKQVQIRMWSYDRNRHTHPRK